MPERRKVQKKQKGERAGEKKNPNTSEIDLNRLNLPFKRQIFILN